MRQNSESLAKYPLMQQTYFTGLDRMHFESRILQQELTVEVTGLMDSPRLIHFKLFLYLL
jgi:hypothetical protein